MTTSTLVPQFSSPDANDAVEGLHPVNSGTRLDHADHWWEADSAQQAPVEGRYPCHPVGDVATRYCSSMAVRAALQAEELRLQASASTSQGRGSGRVTPAPAAVGSIGTSWSHGKNSLKTSSGGEHETIKLLVVGSRQGVLEVIQTLHSLRYARCDDWSPIQQGKKRGEFLSILIQKRPVLEVG